MPYAENEGVKIHYEVDGTPGKPTIVFQHGFLGRLEVWRAYSTGVPLWVNSLTEFDDGQELFIFFDPFG